MAEAFRARGFHVEPATYGGETWLGIMKRHIRIDWFCYRVRKGHVFHFPNVSIPVELFASLQEIDFVGERFLIPSPPEEYLRCKYGPNWATPKRIGYEKDVVDNLPAERLAWTRRLRRFLAARLAGRMAVLQVLGENGKPIADAEVAVAGLGRSRTNGNGYARCYVPREDLYALVVRGGGTGRGAVRGAACAGSEVRVPARRRAASGAYLRAHRGALTGVASTLRRCANPAAGPRLATRRGTSGRPRRWRSTCVGNQRK